MILLDTHILVWWVDNSPRLPKRIKKAIIDASKKGTIFISSISVWEVAFLVNKGKITLPKNVDQWIADIARISFVRFIPIDNQIALKSVELPGEFHGDPADRFLVGTAREYGVKLATADKRIFSYKHVQTV